MISLATQVNERFGKFKNPFNQKPYSFWSVFGLLLLALITLMLYRMTIM